MCVLSLYHCYLCLLGDLLNGFEIVMNNNVVESLKQHRKRVDDPSNTNQAGTTHSTQTQIIGGGGGGSSHTSPVTIHSVISFVDRSELEAVRLELNEKKVQLQQMAQLSEQLERAELMVQQQTQQLTEFESERQKLQQYIPQVNEQFEQQKQLTEQYEQKMRESEEEFKTRLQELSQTIEELRQQCSEKEQVILEQSQQMEQRQSEWEQESKRQATLIQEQESSMEQSKVTISELEQRIQMLEAQLAQKDEELGEAKQTIVQLEERVNTANDTIAAMTAAAAQQASKTAMNSTDKKHLQNSTSSSAQSPLTSPRENSRAVIETTSIPLSENPFVKMSRVGGANQEDGALISPRGTTKRQPNQEEKVVDFRAHLRKTNLLENLEKKRNL